MRNNVAIALLFTAITKKSDEEEEERTKKTRPSLPPLKLKALPGPGGSQRPFCLNLCPEPFQIANATDALNCTFLFSFLSPDKQEPIAYHLTAETLS